MSDIQILTFYMIFTLPGLTPRQLFYNSKYLLKRNAIFVFFLAYNLKSSPVSLYYHNFMSTYVVLYTLQWFTFA